MTLEEFSKLRNGDVVIWNGRTPSVRRMDGCKAKIINDVPDGDGDLVALTIEGPRKGRRDYLRPDLANIVTCKIIEQEKQEAERKRQQEKRQQEAAMLFLTSIAIKHLKVRT